MLERLDILPTYLIIKSRIRIKNRHVSTVLLICFCFSNFFILIPFDAFYFIFVIKVICITFTELIRNSFIFMGFLSKF